MSTPNQSRKPKKRDKRKLFVSIVAIVLAVLMAGSVLFSALITIANAASSTELKTQLDALQSEANTIANQSAELASDIAVNEEETNSVVAQKMEIDQQMDLTRQQIENMEAQIQQYNLLIAAKQEELDQAELDADDMLAQYKIRIRAMEETGDVSYWSILFQASSIMDLLSRMDDIQDIAKADQAMLEQMQETALAIEAAKADIEISRLEMEDAKADLNVLNEQLEVQRNQADALIVQLLVENDQLNSTLDEYGEMEAQIREEMATAQLAYENALADEEAARLIAAAKAAAEAAAAQGTTTTPSTSATSGGFTHPVPGAYVSCAYGYREHPIYGYYSLHSGTDFSANSGTPIYAVKSGTVTTATYNSVYGYMVTVNHNDGFTSTYCHMTHYTVGVGDTVSQGEIVGYVGSTGWSTGPHLHFELAYGGSTVNPMDYLPGS